MKLDHYLIQKIQLKMDYRLECKTPNHEIPKKRKQAVRILTLVLAMIFFGADTESEGNKNEQMNYIKQKLLHSKGTHQQNEKATY